MPKKLLEVLGENGEHWTKRAYKINQEDGTVAYCLVGAMDEAGKPPAAPHYSVLKSMFSGRRGNALTLFNDAPETVWEEVKAFILALESRSLV